MSDQATPRRTITAYLSVRDAPAAISFYGEVFGAELRDAPLTMPDGSIAHAELRLGDATFMLSEERDDWGNLSPATIGDTPVRLDLQVSDADAIFQRAIEAGCETLIPVADQFYGHRSGRLKDPYGHVWIISQVLETLTASEMQERFDAMLKG